MEHESYMNGLSMSSAPSSFMEETTARLIHLSCRSVESPAEELSLTEMPCCHVPTTDGSPYSLPVVNLAFADVSKL